MKKVFHVHPPVIHFIHSFVHSSIPCSGLEAIGSHLGLYFAVLHHSPTYWQTSSKLAWGFDALHHCKVAALICVSFVMLAFSSCWAFDEFCEYIIVSLMRPAWTSSTHQPPMHDGWMIVCGQETLFRCIPFPKLTTIVSYVWTIHMYIFIYLVSNCQVTWFTYLFAYILTINNHLQIYLWYSPTYIGS
jgi:hypothetical protein